MRVASVVIGILSVAVVADYRVPEGWAWAVTSLILLPIYFTVLPWYRSCRTWLSVVLDTGALVGSAALALITVTTAIAPVGYSERSVPSLVLAVLLTFAAVNDVHLLRGRVWRGWAENRFYEICSVTVILAAWLAPQQQALGTEDGRHWPQLLIAMVLMAAMLFATRSHRNVDESALDRVIVSSPNIPLLVLPLGFVCLAVVGSSAQRGEPTAWLFLTLSLGVLLMSGLRTVVTLKEYSELITTTRAMRRRFADLVEDATELVFTCDRHLRILYASPSARAAFSNSTSSLKGSNLPELLQWSDVEVSIAELVQQQGTAVPPFVTHIEDRTYETHVTKHEDGLLAVTKDITVSDILRQQLRDLAYVDGLTRVANRAATEASLAQALNESPERVGVIFADLNRFKVLNDAYGHEVGDAVLVETAHRLTSLAARGVFIGRVGGDEFVVLVDRLAHDVESLVAEASRSLAQPVTVEGATYRIDAALGWTAGRDGDTPDSVLQRADTAMYECKRGASLTLSQGCVPEDLHGCRVVLSLVEPLTTSSSYRCIIALDHPAHGLLRTDSSLITQASWQYVRAEALRSLRSLAATLPHGAIVDLPVAPGELSTPGLFGNVRDGNHLVGSTPLRLGIYVSNGPALAEDPEHLNSMQLLRATGISCTLAHVGDPLRTRGEPMVMSYSAMSFTEDFSRRLATSELTQLSLRCLGWVPRADGTAIIVTGIDDEADRDTLRHTIASGIAGEVTGGWRELHVFDGERAQPSPDSPQKEPVLLSSRTPR